MKTHERDNTVKDLAIPAGFEPATLCLEGRCSIQLSYGIPYYGLEAPDTLPDIAAL